MSEQYKGEKINREYTGKSVISVDQFEREDIEDLFEEAEATIKLVKANGGTDLLKRKKLTNLFYEPSTRTRKSFGWAMQTHGGLVEEESSVQFSSISKGESLQDTINTVEQYCDVIALRHPTIGSAAVAASVAEIPIINAGDGAGEHPTQALLDLFTIKEKLGQVDGVRIALLGDLKNGRTVHSLAKLISKFEGITIDYVSPEELSMPKEYISKLQTKGVSQYEHYSLDDVLPSADVLYVTRVQGERFMDQDEYHRLKDSFKITPETLKSAKEKMIVMHPLPRVGEITSDVDSDLRAVYFEQVGYGMYVRMALLAKVLGKSVLNLAT